MSDELEEVNKYYEMILEFLVNYSMQIVAAMIILIIGLVVSKYAFKYLLGFLLKKNFDKTLSQFVSNFVRILIFAGAIVLALGKLGISIAPFLAAVGALSLTAGLALQGSVSNFAAGVVLIVTKPFKIGDTIKVHGVYGQVKEIKLAYTLLENEDKEEITIPNKHMIGDVLVNSFEYRIVEGSVGVAYDSDIEKSIKIIKDILSLHSEIDAVNEAIVGIEKFNDSSVDIAYRYWVPTENFFKMQYDVNLKIIAAFNKEAIEIPFPQREIKILGERNV